VEVQEILQARERIGPVIRHTPLIHAAALSRRLDGEIWLKPEMLQRTGSFKLRGAYNKIAGLTAADRARGVITASAGNHGQGVAVAAALLGTPAVVVMPANAPHSKIAACRAYGAEVILHGPHYADAKHHAGVLAEERQLSVVPGFDDPAIIAGQGTIGLEVLGELPDLDSVVVPVGGGGLIAGIAVAIKDHARRAQVIGVQAERVAAVVESLAAGHAVTVPAEETIADGIAVERPGELPLALIQQYVDAMVTVNEEDIRYAVAALLQRAKLVAEGAGAVALAAALGGKVDLHGKRAVLILSGGNIDLELLGDIASHEGKSISDG
jgi:threonine dehydratase